MLKAAPLSRTPRRFTTISTAMLTTQSITVCGARCGYAEVIAATPPLMLTATVRM